MPSPETLSSSPIQPPVEGEYPHIDGTKLDERRHLVWRGLPEKPVVTPGNQASKTFTGGSNFIHYAEQRRRHRNSFARTSRAPGQLSVAR